MTSEIPYIHIVHSINTLIESGMFDQFGVVYETIDGYHALFAARVLLEPYEILSERKWGWLEKDLLEEVLERQKRFIASLHYVDPQSASPDLNIKTIALRYIAPPATQKLDIILVGKVFASEQKQASTLATMWYDEIKSLLPPDYSLVPLTTEQEFMLHSGQKLFQEICSSSQTVEIRRFEMFLPRPQGQEVMETHYLVYPFLWHRTGMDQMWQVMAACPTPSVVSFTLRPAYLYESEELHLSRFYKAAIKLTKSEHATGKITGEQAASIYADYLRYWKQPFLIRVQIVALQGVPRALARAAGCALTCGSLASNPQVEFPFLGYELVTPEQNELETARNNLCLVEMADWGNDQAAAPYRRFRYLADVSGAHCAFRLPFVPKAGIPGVSIAHRGHSQKSTD